MNDDPSQIGHKLEHVGQWFSSSLNKKQLRDAKVTGLGLSLEKEPTS